MKETKKQQKEFSEGVASRGKIFRERKMRDEWNGSNANATRMIPFCGAGYDQFNLSGKRWVIIRQYLLE